MTFLKPKLFSYSVCFSSLSKDFFLSCLLLWMIFWSQNCFPTVYVFPVSPKFVFYVRNFYIAISFFTQPYIYLTPYGTCSRALGLGTWLTPYSPSASWVIGSTFSLNSNRMNELPDNIKAADSVQNFKKQLKTLLFRKEFIWLYGPWQLSTDFL